MQAWANSEVLSTKKDAVESKNRKDYATEKWEQEVRDSQKQKKSTSVGGNLSKAEKAMVAAQMVKEAEVRRQISACQARLNRGVELVSSLILSNSEAMNRHVGSLAQLLLGSVFGPGSFLVVSRAFDVFLVSQQNDLAEMADSLAVFTYAFD